MSRPPLPPRPLTCADLAALGVTKRMASRLVADGVLRRVLRGVYVRADVPDSLELRTCALALVVAPCHVVVDRTAAWLHGIDALTYGEHDVLPPVETCAFRGHHPTERMDARGRSRDLAPQDVMTLDGVRVTTPLRTALDLGCNLRRRDAMAALNAFARHHGVAGSTLTSQLPRFRRRRGVVQLRELVPLVDPRVESERESWVLLEISDAGLPRPEPQFWVEVDGGRRFRLDFAYPRKKVCVEYDGREAHERTTEQRRNDRDRRAWLRANGWTVIVVRLGDFSGENLDRWLRELSDALAPSYSNRRW